jgi:glucosylglycerol-phosphate synthase
MPSAVKLILATDIDGTFLFPTGNLCPANLYTVIREHRDDIILIFVTGRAFESIMPLLDNPTLPTPDYIIADVGATILKNAHRTFMPVMPLQSTIAQQWPCEEKILEKLNRIEGIQIQEVPQERRCSFYYTNEDVLPHARETARELGLTMLTSADKYLDFLPKGVSKGSTLKKLLRAENLPEEAVLVAGDTLNDLSLMQTGYRACMVGNSEPALKKAAAREPHVYQASAVGPDGILEAIHFHGFGKSLGISEHSRKTSYGKADLLMVYHRQPFDEIKRGSQYLRRKPKSPNGIIPTLLGFFANGENGAWVAWSQQESRTPDNFDVYVDIDKELYPNLIAARIALTPGDVNLFYKQFSKEAFWPIIFSFPGRVKFIESHWKHFCEINKLFAMRTAEVSARNATVWIHDYNLWMVPAFLRDLRPDLKIAFFHHTSFPGADIFNLIPWKGEIIDSLLKCDYIGFHIPRYVENFIDVARSNAPLKILEKESCAPTYLTYGCALGVPEMTRKISTLYGIVGVGAHPVGIDNSKIQTIVTDQKTRDMADSLMQASQGRKIILSVERLDYVKGPIEKMLAYEAFLEQHPEWHEKVTMINIVTPPAPGMEIYSSTREKLDQVVGRLNGRYSEMNWTPVRYFYRSIPFEELIAYYVAADIAWITPLRDGLNLVCKEYVSAKAASNTQGIMVLSEFAGAAVELKGAILTNPYDINSLKQSLITALEMDAQEIEFRMQTMKDRVQKYDVNTWGEDFLSFRTGTDTAAA